MCQLFFLLEAKEYAQLQLVYKRFGGMEGGEERELGMRDLTESQAEGRTAPVHQLPLTDVIMLECSSTRDRSVCSQVPLSFVLN